MQCKYCGMKSPSEASLRSHEGACPEMRYFADFVLAHSELSGEVTAIVGGVETTDLRIIAIILRAGEND